MTEEEQFNKLWFQYPTDLCKNKRGGKQPAFQAFKKLKLDEDQYNTLLLNMAAQVRNDRKDPDAYRWPFVSTYLNQRRFDDVVNIVEKPTYTANKCSVNGCNQDVHGSRFIHCIDHLPETNRILLNKMRQKYVDLGLVRDKDETKQQHLDRCRKVYVDSLGGVVK